MKWLDTFIQRAYNRARERDEIMPIETSRRGGGNTLSANKRVASTYDDTGVINFTVYGANGGKIVEAVRYDTQNDRERVHRYVIDEESDFVDSLNKIMTMEYLR